MFDISPLEMLTIALVALIVFGPQRLPDIARRAGHYIREIRRAASDLTAGLEREVQEIQAPIKELKEDLTKPVSELRGSIDDTAKSIQEPLQDAAAELSKQVNPGGPGDIPGAPDQTVTSTGGQADESGPQHEVDESRSVTPSTEPGSSDGSSVDHQVTASDVTANPPSVGRSAADQSHETEPVDEPRSEPPKAGDPSHDADSVGESNPPTVRWIADEPTVGVSPADAWKGIDDPIPPALTSDDTPIPVAPTATASPGPGVEPESEPGDTGSPSAAVDRPDDVGTPAEREPAE